MQVDKQVGDMGGTHSGVREAYTEARASYEKALRYDPTLAHGYYRSLAATLRALHRPADAAQYERKACELSSIDTQEIQTWVEWEAQYLGHTP